MKELTTDELKKIQLDILVAVADFCEQNGIQYWLDSGTLLGAVRHKGYIPWDDDIDVGMLREDYDKFLALFNQKQSRYVAITHETDPDFYLPHMKVFDPSTILYEPNEDGCKFYVNIDIFVYDNAPDDDKAVKKMYDLRDKWRKKFFVQNQDKFMTGGAGKKFLKKARRLVYTIFGLYSKKKDYVALQIENSKKYANAQTKRVGNFTSYTRIATDKSVFNSFVDVEFEGRKFKAPAGYDEWLRNFYGDYMQLPPENKRVSHHSFKAYATANEEGVKDRQ